MQDLYSLFFEINLFFHTEGSHYRILFLLNCYTDFQKNIQEKQWTLAE